MGKLHRKWIELSYATPGSLRAEDIPYDPTTSVKDQIDALRTGGLTLKKYRSTIPSVSHLVTHNFDTIELEIEVLVEDPDTGHWSKEVVGQTCLNSNQILISLTEACNIFIIVKKV